MEIAGLRLFEFCRVRVVGAHDDWDGVAGAVWEKGKIYRHAQRRKTHFLERSVAGFVGFHAVCVDYRIFDLRHLFFLSTDGADCALLRIDTDCNFSGKSACTEREAKGFCADVIKKRTGKGHKSTPESEKRTKNARFPLTNGKNVI